MSDMLFLDDVGDHGHLLLRSVATTASDGRHAHVWYVPDELEVGERKLSAGSLIFSMYDGAHTHALEDEMAVAGGDHRHGVPLMGRIWATEEDGMHSHELLVKRTGSAGAHTHILEIGGMRLESLMPADIVRMQMEHDEEEEDEMEEPVMRASRKGAAIYLKGKKLCQHDELRDAGKCMAARTLMIRNRLLFELDDENLEKTGWLLEAGVKHIAAKRLTAMKGSFGGGLARALETLGRQ